MQIRISKIRVIASAVMLSLLLSAFGIGAGAQTTDTRSLAAMSTNLDPDGRVYMQIKAVLNKNVWVYERISVSVGNTSLSVQGIVINGVAYVPFRSAAAAISGSSYIYAPSTRTSVMSAPGLQIIATDGCYVTYANGRTLFNTTPNVIMSDGRMYIPAAVFAKAVGMSVNSVSGGIRLVGSYYPLLYHICCNDGQPLRQQEEDSLLRRCRYNGRIKRNAKQRYEKGICPAEGCKDSS